MARSTFKVLFYVNGSKEKDGIIPIMGRVTIDTRHSVCSIKQNENGKFDFKIDGVSHVNWFRKKMNELREAIGIPKPRQNRSMKL